MNKFKAKVKTQVKKISQDVSRKKMTSFSRIFRSKSKSFYGVGTLIFLGYREVITIIESTSDFQLSTDNIVGGIISHFIGFSIESITNMVYAAIWPVTLLKMHNKYMALALLALIAIIYLIIKYGLNNGFMAKIHRVPQHTINQINQNCLDCFQLISENNSKVSFSEKLRNTQHNLTDINNYIELAETHQLDHWRSHPDSCLSLILLLSQFSATASNTQDYQEKIVREAIKHKLDEELNPIERCFLYWPLKQSTTNKDVTWVNKKYKNIEKKNKASAEIPYFFELFNI